MISQDLYRLTGRVENRQRQQWRWTFLCCRRTTCCVAEGQRSERYRLLGPFQSRSKAWSDALKQRVRVSSEMRMRWWSGKFQRRILPIDQLDGEIHQVSVAERLFQECRDGSHSIFGIRLVEVETAAENDGQIRAAIPDSTGQFIAAESRHCHVSYNAVKRKRVVDKDL